MFNQSWTPDAIKSLLDRNPQAVERAVVAIYQRQTDDERERDETRHDNGVGFSAFHAHMGGYYARWVLSGRRLSGPHLDKARRMMQRYVGQLMEIALQREGREECHV